MTQEEIIAMAREAGFASLDYLTHNRLERFAALVAANEREQCAKVCEDDMGWLDNGGGELCAKAIRARSENGTA